MKDAKFLSTDATDLVANYSEATLVIASTIANNDWKLNGDIPNLSITDIVKLQSKSQKKVLRDRINRVIQKPSLRAINSLLLMANEIKSNGSQKTTVTLSEKEIAIQKKRKEWKKSLAETERLLAAYKEEKGDYYKRK